MENNAVGYKPRLNEISSYYQSILTYYVYMRNDIKVFLLQYESLFVFH